MNYPAACCGAALAMALWESLDDSQREKELSLTPEQLAEIDQRLAEHLADPGSAIPWEKVSRKLSKAEFTSSGTD